MSTHNPKTIAQRRPPKAITQAVYLGSWDIAHGTVVPEPPLGSRLWAVVFGLWVSGFEIRGPGRYGCPPTPVIYICTIDSFVRSPADESVIMVSRAREFVVIRSSYGYARRLVQMSEICPWTSA